MPSWKRAVCFRDRQSLRTDTFSSLGGFIFFIISENLTEVVASIGQAAVSFFLDSGQSTGAHHFASTQEMFHASRERKLDVHVSVTSKWEIQC